MLFTSSWDDQEDGNVINEKWTTDKEAHEEGNGELTVCCHVPVCLGFKHAGSDILADIHIEISKKLLQNHARHAEGTADRLEMEIQSH